MKNVGLSISQQLPCPLAIWAFALDGNLVIFVAINLVIFVGYKYNKIYCYKL